MIWTKVVINQARSISTLLVANAEYLGTWEIGTFWVASANITTSYYDGKVAMMKFTSPI